jgi:hypothetical protein
MHELVSGGALKCSDCGSDNLEVVMSGRGTFSPEPLQALNQRYRRVQQIQSDLSDLIKLLGVNPEGLINSQLELHCQSCGRTTLRPVLSL